MLLSCCIYRFDIYFGVSSQNLKFFHVFQACTIALESFSVSHLSQTVSFYIKSWEHAEHDTSDAARKQLWVGACHGGEL